MGVVNVLVCQYDRDLWRPLCVYRSLMGAVFIGPPEWGNGWMGDILHVSDVLVIGFLSLCTMNCLPLTFELKGDKACAQRQKSCHQNIRHLPGAITQAWCYSRHASNVAILLINRGCIFNVPGSRGL